MGRDTIIDFDSATAGTADADIIEVFGFGFADRNAVLDRATPDGTNVRIDLDADDIITIVGVNINDLSAADFIVR